MPKQSQSPFSEMFGEECNNAISSILERVDRVRDRDNRADSRRHISLAIENRIAAGTIVGNKMDETYHFLQSSGFAGPAIHFLIERWLRSLEELLRAQRLMK
ncbi:MAG: hypothetical protein RBR18_13170 [Desulfovibrionaceae bacterium]|nr:hypothetical protein [Desulfovibrionaceae bacterium]